MAVSAPRIILIVSKKDMVLERVVGHVDESTAVCSTEALVAKSYRTIAAAGV